MSDVDPVRSCISKKRYGSSEQAESVAAVRFATSGVQLRVYACDAGCLGFHLTSRGVDYVEPKPGWRPAVIGAREQARRRRIEERHGKRRR